MLVKPNMKICGADTVIEKRVDDKFCATTGLNKWASS